MRCTSVKDSGSASGIVLEDAPYLHTSGAGQSGASSNPSLYIGSGAGQSRSSATPLCSILAVVLASLDPAPPLSVYWQQCWHILGVPGSMPAAQNILCPSKFLTIMAKGDMLDDNGIRVPFTSSRAFENREPERAADRLGSVLACASGLEGRQPLNTGGPCGGKRVAPRVTARLHKGNPIRCSASQGARRIVKSTDVSTDTAKTGGFCAIVFTFRS
ncbi:hypothetical protein P4O66_012797 [Electrophorus voltai]|uniref:Uncharacterized protein n=1 Tax=Electrophorus voltai TaxID=2609070 RepID=A0AAD8ZV38_9TELE|nr:hypothetical protein P4O66_012797 [Electrophorus voltai]